ncbi:hypothetical protein FRC07_001036 [Ceratobasidium sp. 392]|nr:hypothetical protein FRC07_001036 [Ceratobasidium sp. 392]
MYLSYLLTFVFIAGSAIAAPVELAPRQSPCSDLHLIFLAGTTELGFGIVGSPLRDNLALAIPGTTAYAVPYNTIAEYVTTVAAGAWMTEQHIANRASACPNQRFVLGGYSKGALVVHAINLAPALKAKALAIIVFGDPALKSGGSPFWPINQPSVDTSPRDGSTPTQNIASFCNPGDYFCDPEGNLIPPHLNYANDGSTMVAANFVKAKV